MRRRDHLVLTALLLLPLAGALLIHTAREGSPEPVIPALDACGAASEPIVEPAPVEPEPVLAEPVLAEPVLAEPVLAGPAPEPTSPVQAEPAAPLLPGAMVLVHDGKAILADHADPTWSKGKIRYASDDGMFSARVRADVTAVPPELAALVGQRMVVHSADGSACVAELGPLFVYAAETGENLESGDDRVAAREHAAEILGYRGALVAELRGQDGPCHGIWARRADLPAPRVFGSIPADAAIDGPLAARVLEALHGAPELAELERERLAFDREYGPDDARPFADAVAEGLMIHRWREIGGERLLIEAEVRIGEEICSSGFFGERAFLFEVQGDALVRRPQGVRRPVALLDLDRDEHLEAVTVGLEGWSLYSEGPHAGELRSIFELPYLGCPC